MPKKSIHKYKVGDLVGIVVDCMANCEILRCVPKVKGKGLTYIAKAVKIHHPRPKESFFGKNSEFEVRERQITLRLSNNLHKGMKAFTFAEVSLAKKCFHMVRVIAKDEFQARRSIYGGDWGWAFLGFKDTNSKIHNTKTSLVRTRD